MSGKRRLLLKDALIIFALSLVFALIFCTSNTPLGASISSDNAMYLTMGTALREGYAPYTDVFDHKGPLLFLLQWLAQAFGGGYSMTAVFVMEVVFLFASLMILRDIARRMGLASPWIAILAYLALMGPVLYGGNLGEEYANLFTLIGIDVMLAVFGDGRSEEKKLFAPACLLGALTMLCFLLRANNALPLCAMALALSAYLLFTRAFSSLGRCAAGFALGLIVILAPVCWWLYAEGALDEAFYGSILHNFMYAETGNNSRVATLLTTSYGHMAMLIAALTCLGALCMFRRSPALAAAMVCGAAASGFAAFISHKYYDHYLMLGVPLSAMGVCALRAAVGKLAAKKQKIIGGVCVLIFGAALVNAGIAANEYRLYERKGLDAFTADAKALYSLVPEEDRDSFMAYRVEPKWYVVTGALPCMRFYFLQEILADADPAVMEEIVQEFEDDPPSWVVIFYNREFGPPYDPRVAEIFETRYEFVASAGEYQLLRIREDL